MIKYKTKENLTFVRETLTLEKKSALGQYFTPPTVVEFMYQMLWLMMHQESKKTKNY